MAQLSPFVLIENIQTLNIYNTLSSDDNSFVYYHLIELSFYNAIYTNKQIDTRLIKSILIVKNKALSH